MEKPKENLAENLKRLRKKHGLGQKELAEKMVPKASWRTIAQIEQLHRFATDEMLAKLAKALGVTVSDLLRDPKHPASPLPQQLQVATGNIPAQLLSLLSRLAGDDDAIETLTALAAKFLGVPVSSTRPTRRLKTGTSD